MSELTEPAPLHAAEVEPQKSGRRTGHLLAWGGLLILLAILALSVEIQQRLTGRGAMDLADLVAGIGGFLVLGGAYLALSRTAALIRKSRWAPTGVSHTCPTKPPTAAYGGAGCS